MELPKFTESEIDSQNTDLQRTDDWFADRLGLFTGSEMKKLMSCKSKKQGKNWYEHFWITDFGDTAITYIIEKALERATGKNTEHVQTYAMIRGTALEQEAKEFFIENYKKEDVGFEFKFNEKGFVTFLKNSGASVDGEVVFSDSTIGCIAYENKCPENVRIHMEQCLQDVTESHPYFWQLICEMLCLGTDKAILCSYDPRFTEKSKLKYSNCVMSSSHKFGLFCRLIIAEKLVEKLIETDFDCNVNAELESICSQIPTDFEGLQIWYEENIVSLQL